jgi:hypothetical protein
VRTIASSKNTDMGRKQASSNIEYNIMCRQIQNMTLQSLVHFSFSINTPSLLYTVIEKLSDGRSSRKKTWFRSVHGRLDNKLVDALAINSTDDSLIGEFVRTYHTIGLGAVTIDFLKSIHNIEYKGHFEPWNPYYVNGRLVLTESNMSDYTNCPTLLDRLSYILKLRLEVGKRKNNKRKQDAEIEDTTLEQSSFQVLGIPSNLTKNELKFNLEGIKDWSETHCWPNITSNNETVTDFRTAYEKVVKYCHDGDCESNKRAASEGYGDAEEEHVG